MTLFEIENAILECVDADTGEVIDGDKLDELDMQWDAKVENIALWIKDLDAEAKALKAEKDSFAKRQKVAENKMERLKKYLSEHLEGKWKSSKVEISFRKSTAVEIEDGAFFADQFLTFKAPEPNKSAILTALKCGEQVEGAHLVERMNIQIK